MMRPFNREIIRAFLLVTLIVGVLGCDSGPGASLPDIPSMTYPPDGAVDEPNALELQWQDASDADSYHVQMSADVEFNEVMVDERGVKATFLAVTDLQIDATYYWRVRAQNASGFSDWSAVRTFTPATEATVPAEPSLMEPADDAVLTETQVMLKWQATKGATSYQVQVSQEPVFLRNDADLQVRSTTRNVIGLIHGYTYYWRVRAQNPVGYGEWSATRRFDVEG